jgi:hypothetical protein
MAASPLAHGQELAIPRGRDAPRPWLVPAGVLSSSAGGDVIRFRPAGYVRFGLGGVADLSVGARYDLERCNDCEDAEPVAMATAAFRVGQELEVIPLALMVGFERTVASHSQAGKRPEYSALQLALGTSIGSTRLSGGAHVFQGSGDDQLEPANLEVRPFGSLEFRPSARSKTLIVAETAFEPLFEDEQMNLRWIAAGGVRYLARDWISSELMVRGGLGDESFIMISARFHVHTRVVGP